MAIQVRRGNYADFDPSKMVAGEFAVCLDNGYVYITLSPGNSIRLGTAETIEEALEMAEAYMEDAEAWAKGTRGGVPVPSTDPAYHNNSKYYSEQAEGAEENGLISEGYAVGNQHGTPVGSTSPYYHNNSKYYCEKAEEYKDEAEAIVGIGIATTTTAGIVKPDGTTITVESDGTIHGASQGASTLTDLTDTVISSPSNNQVLTYESSTSKWKNKAVPSYTLPTASSSTLGGVKIGTGLSISSGVENVQSDIVFSVDVPLGAGGTSGSVSVGDIIDVVYFSKTIYLTSAPSGSTDIALNHSYQDAIEEELVGVYGRSYSAAGTIVTITDVYYNNIASTYRTCTISGYAAAMAVTTSSIHWSHHLILTFCRKIWNIQK